MSWERYCKFIGLLAGILCFTTRLCAVQVSGTDGTGSHYTTEPADDFGFANVAQVWDTSEGFYTTGIYLGNGWMLGAYHPIRSGSNGFAFGNVILNGSSYDVAANTAVRILDPITQLPVDLAMFQLTPVPTDPLLKSMLVSGTTPPPDSNLSLIGNGVNRADPLIYWTDSWVETTDSTYAYAGYNYGTGQSMRWGMGRLSGTTSLDDTYGVTSFFYTTFQNTNGSAMAAPGDSGGGVFFKSGSTWQLAGILLTIDTYPGQPVFSTSAFGNITYAADLSFYSSQINSVMAIPPGFSAWAFGYFKTQFSNPVISGLAGTPQNDGISNGLKYLCNINPTVPMSRTDRAALPTVSVSGTSYLTMIYRQNSNLTGLTVSVESSLDLQTWTSVTPDSSATIGSDLTTGDPMIELQVKRNGAQKLFLRLRIGD